MSGARSGDGEALVGRSLGRYRVIAPLGAGGMGIVYRAHDETLHRDVALKLLPEDLAADPVARDRLLAEARAAAALNHPHIITVHEVGEAEGRVFLATELVEGRVLTEVIGEDGLPVSETLRLGAQIAAGLAHAHGQGVIHRDLKAANVVVTPDGRAKVLDFGIARRGGSATDETSVVGTPEVLAPELLHGDLADARSDVWSLGVLLYQMASGRMPFAGATTYEVTAAILNADPVPLPSRVPAGVRGVVMHCLEREPMRRYASAAEVAAALAALQDRAGEPEVETPGATRSRSRAWAIAASAVVVAVAIALAVARGWFRTGGVGERNAIRSLAVLPLESLSHDPEQEYFADGMTEELITSLATLENVRVISRTSVMRYKGTSKPIQQIARELGVEAVIEGSALRAGERVRITAQLIDARQDRQMWAKSYEDDLRDILAMQGMVAKAIAAEIRTKLGGASAARAVDPGAYEAYLKGRYYWNQRTESSLATAIDYLNQSIRADSTFAPAQAGLAQAYVVLPSHSSRSEAECMPRARSAALAALAIDPNLADAHAALAAVELNARNWSEGEAEYKRAIALDPNDGTAHQWYGEMLSMLGRHDEAIAESRRAQEIDPVSIPINVNLAARYANAHRVDEAIAAWKETIALDPNRSEGCYELADVYLMAGRFPDAIAAFARGDSIDGVPAQLCEDLARALASGGRRGFWLEMLAIMRPDASPAALAGIYAQLGDATKAFQSLDRAVERGESKALFWVKTDWKLASLHSDPRFSGLLRRIGMPT